MACKVETKVHQLAMILSSLRRDSDSFPLRRSVSSLQMLIELKPGFHTCFICSAMQRDLGLQPAQLAAARDLWEGFAADMSELRTSRERATRVMHEEDQMQSATLRPAYAQTASTIRLLENVAELRRNAALQQELVANMHRTFLLQVCCPDTFGRLIRCFWPHQPDLTRLVCQLAGCSGL